MLIRSQDLVQVLRLCARSLQTLVCAYTRVQESAILISVRECNKMTRLCYGPQGCSIQLIYSLPERLRYLQLGDLASSETNMARKELSRLTALECLEGLERVFPPGHLKPHPILGKSFYISDSIEPTKLPFRPAFTVWKGAGDAANVSSTLNKFNDVSATVASGNICSIPSQLLQRFPSAQLLTSVMLGVDAESDLRWLPRHLRHLEHLTLAQFTDATRELSWEAVRSVISHLIDGISAPASEWRVKSISLTNLTIPKLFLLKNIVENERLPCLLSVSGHGAAVRDGNESWGVFHRISADICLYQAKRDHYISLPALWYSVE
jgi:hypothetical protein